jgi:hypothetical protein
MLDPQQTWALLAVIEVVPLKQNGEKGSQRKQEDIMANYVKKMHNAINQSNKVTRKLLLKWKQHNNDMVNTKCADDSWKMKGAEEKERKLSLNGK